jgi:hypothetical protein
VAFPLLAVLLIPALAAAVMLGVMVPLDDPLDDAWWFLAGVPAAASALATAALAVSNDRTPAWGLASAAAAPVLFVVLLIAVNIAACVFGTCGG